MEVNSNQPTLENSKLVQASTPVPVTQLPMLVLYSNQKPTTNHLFVPFR